MMGPDTRRMRFFRWMRGMGLRPDIIGSLISPENISGDRGCILICNANMGALYGSLQPNQPYMPHLYKISYAYGFSWGVFFCGGRYY